MGYLACTSCYNSLVPGELLNRALVRMVLIGEKGSCSYDLLIDASVVWSVDFSLQLVLQQFKNIIIK